MVGQQQRLDELRGQINLGELKPIHPRDHYWFDRGLADQPFTLEAPTGRGGSYYARYRAMYEAGVKARKAVSA